MTPKRHEAKEQLGAKERLGASRHTVTWPVVAAMVGALVTTDVAIAGSRDRDTGVRNTQETVSDFSARKRRHRGGNAAAAAMFGMVAGTIASVAAAQAYRDRARRHHYYHGYYPHPGYRAYAYEGPVYYPAPYAPGYYYRPW